MATYVLCADNDQIIKRFETANLESATTTALLAMEQAESDFYANRKDVFWYRGYLFTVVVDSKGDEHFQWVADVFYPPEPSQPPGCRDEWRDHSWLGSGTKLAWDCNSSGVLISECCIYCGIYRVSDLWAKGQCRIIAYQPADEESLAWAKLRREHDRWG